MNAFVCFPVFFLIPAQERPGKEITTETFYFLLHPTKRR
jgi:hypothetical protein